MAGEVLVDGQREDKPGSTFPDTAVITVKSNPIPYVSRGGLKLEKAVNAFRLGTEGKDLHGCGKFHRRVYGLYAPERSG